MKKILKHRFFPMFAIIALCMTVLIPMPALAKEENSGKITVGAVTITVPEGLEPTFPDTVKVNWGNGKVTDEPVEDWVEEACNFEAQENQHCYYGLFTNDKLEKETLVAVVTIVPPSIIRVHEIPVVQTPSGTAPDLPAKVTVDYNNNTTDTVDVTWSDVPEDSYKVRGGGEFSVPGSVAGYDQPVSVTVRVTPATVVGVDPVSEVVTASGESPVLPDTVRVTWSNGDVTEEPVEWTVPDSSAFDKEGTVRVPGVVSATDPKVRTDIEALVTVEPKPAEPSVEGKKDTESSVLTPKSETEKLGDTQKSSDKAQQDVKLVKVEKANDSASLPDTGVNATLVLLCALTALAGMIALAVSRIKFAKN